MTKTPAGMSRVNEICDRIGVSRASLYREIQRGKLKARKLGGLTVVLDEDWESYRKSLPVAQLEPESSQRTA